MLNRKSKTGIILAGIAVLAVLGAAGYKGYLYYREVKNTGTYVSKEKYEYFTYVETGNTNEENTVVITSDSAYTVINCVVPGKYICIPDVEYQYDKTNEDILEIKKALYRVYDLETGELLRTIDIEKVKEETAPNMRMQTLISPGIVVTGEANYIYFKLRDSADKQNRIKKRSLYINVETGKGFIPDPGNPPLPEELEYGDENYEKMMDSHGQHYWLRDDRTGVLAANGFETFEPASGRREWEGLFVMHVTDRILGITTMRKYLPEENEKLYSEFPGLKEYKGEGDEYVTVYLEAYLTTEEIMELFMEDGEEISFEGCVIQPEDSIDWRLHEVHSFEEIEQWYDGGV